MAASISSNVVIMFGNVGTSSAFWHRLLCANEYRSIKCAGERALSETLHRVEQDLLRLPGGVCLDD